MLREKKTDMNNSSNFMLAIVISIFLAILHKTSSDNVLETI